MLARAQRDKECQGGNHFDVGDFVDRCYDVALGREADDDGLNYWVSQLDGGTASREDIFAGFAGSIEFANLCAGYGISA